MNNIQFDPWTEFGLNLITAAVGLVNSLGSTGTKVVDVRTGEYRYWDPETLKVDKEVEDFFISKIKEKGIYGSFLSEEAEELNFEKTDNCPPEMDEKICFFSDPFDGSLLYKRNILAFWYTTMAIYSDDKKIKTAAVGDCSAKTVDFCDNQKAYTAIIESQNIKDVSQIKPSDIEKLSDAFIETYLMKPHYLYPTVFDFEPLFKKVKFILPNGGPAGFCDVAKGKIDVYLANRQPFLDVFTGLAIAENAGCVITDYDGNPPEFNIDINARFNLVCSANESLHEQVLESLKECGQK